MLAINQELHDEIVRIVKNKPGKEELTAENLNEAIERITINVSKFCRLRKLPMDLKYTLADMVVNAYDMLNPSTEEKDDTNSRVKSIKQGDTTIELATTQEISYNSIEGIITAYVNDLLLYRGVFWR